MTQLIHDDLDIIAALRALMPVRAMSWSEAHALAERQAARLLDLMFIDEPPVPQFVISSLPGVVVDWKHDWPTSGMAVQGPQHWRIVLRANEPRVRQRFTLAHEFKHLLDDIVVRSMSRHPAAELRQPRAERLCDYFAACLLMPRPWIKHDYYGGLQGVGALARRYYVSRQAMTTRLRELGLTHMTLASEPETHRRRTA
jgi:IrrE N-terminal-like domain